jgi:hypothetical protein
MHRTCTSLSFHLDLTPYLSAWGRKVVAIESHQCIGDFSGEFPNLTMKRLMKPQYVNILGVPAIRRIMNKLTMGSVPGHPAEPLLMVWGNSDGTGDGVMVAADEQALADEYCGQGVPVLAHELPRIDHTDAGGVFFVQAFPWLATRFAGLPPVSTC